MEIKKTQTELAMEYFLENVKKIKEVVEVELIGGETLVEQSIIVIIPYEERLTDKLERIEMKVYDLISKTYREYNRARLEVYVKDTRSNRICS